MKQLIVLSSMLLLIVFWFGCSEQSINQPSFQAKEQINSTENKLVGTDAGIEGPAFRASLYTVNPAVKREKKGEASFRFDDKKTRMEFTLRVNDISDVVSAFIFVGDNYNSDKTPVVELFPAKRYSDTTSDSKLRTVAQGVITPTDLLYQFRGKNLEALHQLMLEGRAVVSVSTDRYHGAEISGTILFSDID